MKKGTKWLLVLGFAMAAAVLAVFVLLRTGQGESFFCQFRMFSPNDVHWQGPIHVGTEWTQIDAPKPLKAIPFTQDIQLLANPDTHILHSDFPGFYEEFDQTSFWMMKGQFENIKTKELTAFEVKIADVNDRSVQLMQSSLGQETTGEVPRPMLAFNLQHEHWKKMIFHPDFESHAIYVRASSPFVLESIYWLAG